MTASNTPPHAAGARIGPGSFFVIGVVLFALKFMLDRFVARVGFGRDWSIFNYLIPNETYALPMLPPQERWFYLTMLAIALPFVGIGISVTLRRLADAHLPGWLAWLFFVPVVNLLFFAALSVLPTVSSRPRADEESGSPAPLSSRPPPSDAPALPLEYGRDDPRLAESALFASFIPQS